MVSSSKLWESPLAGNLYYYRGEVKLISGFPAQVYRLLSGSNCEEKTFYQQDFLLHVPSCLPLPGISQEVDSSGVSDQGRGSGCSSSAPARIAPVVRTVCYIAAELVRLVSCVESMKPVLQSLYHRILLYPPPQHRTEAIRIMKEVGGGGGGVIADLFSKSTL